MFILIIWECSNKQDQQCQTREPSANRVGFNRTPRITHEKVQPITITIGECPSKFNSSVFVSVGTFLDGKHRTALWGASTGGLVQCQHCAELLSQLTSQSHRPTYTYDYDLGWGWGKERRHLQGPRSRTAAPRSRFKGSWRLMRLICISWAPPAGGTPGSRIDSEQAGGVACWEHFGCHQEELKNPCDPTLCMLAAANLKLPYWFLLF